MPSSTRLAMAALLGLITAIAFEAFAVTTVLPVVARDLGAERWFSLAFAATITTGVVGMTLGGSWADARGPLAPLTAGGAMFCSGLALTVVAPDVTVFVLGRLLQGLGGGIDSVLIYVLVGRLFAEPDRPRVLGQLTTAWLLPSLAGPLVSGLLAQAVGWRAVFALVLGAAVVSLLVLRRVVRAAVAAEPRADVASPVRVVGRRERAAAGAAVAVVGLHLAGQQKMPALAVGTVVAVVAVGVAATRLLPRGTLQGRAGVPRLVALRGLLGATVGATDSYLPLFLQHERGWAPAAAGGVFAVGAFGWSFGAWLQGRSSRPAEDPTLVRWATALVLCAPLGALVLVSGAVPAAVAVPVAVAAGVLAGTGMGLGVSRTTAAVLAASDPREQGLNSSALQLADSLGASVLLAATGAALALGAGGYVPAFVLVLAVGSLGLLLAARPNRAATPQVVRRLTSKL